MSNYKQGKILTENLIGCTNKESTITYRSGWERKVFFWLQDLVKMKKIKTWSSEDTIMQYFYSVDQKHHRYFIDFTIVKNDDTVILIEVKPYSETVYPKKPKSFKSDKQKNNYTKSITTYIKNQEKWKATQEWCKEENKRLGFNKFSFIVWTEITDKPNPNPDLVHPVLSV